MSDMRWGRLSDEEKALTSVPDDPDASAVVLADVGSVEIFYLSDRFELQMRRHRRVKILSEAGYELGEFSIRYDDDGSNVRGIKGHTFVPQPDGSYERVKLESRAVMDGEVRDGVRELRFSMPALAPGAIFEYEYEYTSESFFSPPTWYFQSSQPTLYSRYSFTQPEFFDYVAYTQGSLIQPKEATAGYSSRYSWDNMEWTWKAENVPALREEPYTTTEEDYAHKVELQLNRIAFPNQMPRQILSTWEEVASDLDKHDLFGRRLRARGDVRELARSVTGTDEERARALYDMVREGYVWNGRGGIFAERDLREVVETKSGTAGELNLLLLSLLREAGIPAEPVLISTRSNGKILTIYPLASRFDGILVLVQIDGAPAQLLDATDRHRPYGMPPVQALSGTGWIATPEQQGWIDFGAPGGTSTTTSVMATLSPDGSLAGKMAVRLSGYDALRLRRRLAEEAAESPTAAASGSGEAAASEAADADDLDLSEVVVEGLDDVAEPVTMRAVAASSAGELVGDEMYFSPFIAMRMEENPFTLKERSFPVDFAYPFKRTYISTIQLPEGFAPEALPEPVGIAIPSGSVTYTRSFALVRGALQLNAVLNVLASDVQPEEYAALRSLYDEIVAAESEALVLVRQPLAPEAEQEGSSEAGAPPEAEATSPTGDNATGDQ